MAVPALLFLVAFAVRVASGAFFIEPAYPDSLYYVNVARELATGSGFSVDYIWSFVDVGGVLPAQGVLPIPSNAHWMPLSVLLQVPSIWLLGPSSLASALPFWLAAAAVAPLTWFIALDAGLERWQALLGGLLVAVPGMITPYLAQADNFGPYMLLGCLALWLCTRAVRGHGRSFWLGGLVVGLAFLARNDGILLAVPFALLVAVDVVRRPHVPRVGWGAVCIGLGCLLLLMAPWLWRQLDVFGSITPSAANGRILWIEDYRQLFSVTSETTLDSFLAQGLGPLLKSRIDGLLSALLILATMPLLVFLVPFVLIGAWLRRGDVAFQPWLVYAVTLLLFSALVSAVHVPYGTFVHSAVALVPHAYLLVMVAISAVVAWVARRRPRWHPPRAERVFGTMAVAVVAVGALLGSASISGAWRREASTRMPLLAGLAEAAAPGERLMSPDPGAYWFGGGWPGIVTPEDPLEVVEQALARYDVRWLALEADHLTDSLAPVLRGDVRPAWLSAPLVTVPRVPAGATVSDAGPVRAALFAVCFDDADDRCAA